MNQMTSWCPFTIKHHATKSQVKIFMVYKDISKQYQRKSLWDGYVLTTIPIAVLGERKEIDICITVQ